MNYWFRAEFGSSFDPLNNAFPLEGGKKKFWSFWTEVKGETFFTQSSAKSIKIEDIKYQSVFLPFRPPHTFFQFSHSFSFSLSTFWIFSYIKHTFKPIYNNHLATPSMCPLLTGGRCLGIALCYKNWKSAPQKIVVAMWSLFRVGC